MTRNSALALPLAAVALVALVACSPSAPPAPPAPKAAEPRSEAPATTPSPAVGSNDPSTPPAATVTTPAPAEHTAKDSPASQPMSALTKEEEKTAMPMAGHGNNHASPSLDPKTSGGK